MAVQCLLQLLEGMDVADASSQRQDAAKAIHEVLAPTLRITGALQKDVYNSAVSPRRASSSSMMGAQAREREAEAAVAAAEATLKAATASLHRDAIAAAETVLETANKELQAAKDDAEQGRYRIPPNQAVNGLEKDSEGATQQGADEAQTEVEQSAADPEGNAEDPAGESEDPADTVEPGSPSCTASIADGATSEENHTTCILSDSRLLSDADREELVGDVRELPALLGVV